MQRIAEKENVRLKNMSKVLNEKVIAQDKAIEKMVKAIQRNHVSYRDWETDRKSTRLNSSHITRTRMPSSA